MKVVKLRDKSEVIQLTAEEALEEAAKSSFKADEVVIILFNEKESEYEWWQGGSLSCERIYWHLSKIRKGLLD